MSPTKRKRDTSHDCHGSGQLPLIVDWRGRHVLRCKGCFATWEILGSQSSQEPIPGHKPRKEAHEKALQDLADHANFCGHGGYRNKGCRHYADLNRIGKMSRGEAREKFCERGKALTREAMRFAEPQS